MSDPTGEATRRKVASARSTRDREEELPAGVLRTTDVQGANGTLAVSTPGGARDDLVKLTFRDGRIVEVATKGANAAQFRSWYESVSGDRDRISELVIGTHPDLLPISDGGEVWLFVTDGTLTAGKTRLIEHGRLHQ